jgi:hypothetical protein
MGSEDLVQLAGCADDGASFLAMVCDCTQFPLCCARYSQMQSGTVAKVDQLRKQCPNRLTCVTEIYALLTG